MQFAVEPPLDLRDSGVGVVGIGEIDLDVIFGPRFPRTILREGMPRAGDDAPAGGGKPLDRGVADAAARPGEEERPALPVVRWSLCLFRAHGYSRVLLHRACGPARRNVTRSCKRNGRSCQNSISTGTTRYPDQCGGRGTAPMANFAVLRATAFSNARRLSSGADCLLAHAPIWATREREAK